ncbi:MAG: hypothetical protein DMF38_01995 [Verrucomicrobia bacterium]|nr:MAG: hypothetical protein DMF38_01995 [Verrucomicrobiota bacterium]
MAFLMRNLRKKSSERALRPQTVARARHRGFIILGTVVAGVSQPSWLMRHAGFQPASVGDRQARCMSDETG